jgi:hypothetical protein
VLLDELAVIPGSVPNLIDLPAGCRFASRCAARIDHNNVLATKRHPTLSPVEGGHLVRCWLYHHEDGSPRPDADTWPEAVAMGDAATSEAMADPTSPASA